jgi:hypothetical protein
VICFAPFPVLFRTCDVFAFFLQFFPKKGLTVLGAGPITRLHRRGAALANAATRTGWLRASVLKFFDIVDKQEGMRGQRYGAKVCASWRRRIDLIIDQVDLW